MSRLLGLVAAAWLVAGCVPVLIGGAAAGGYYLGKDERPPAVIAEDSGITAKVKSRLIGDKYVDAFAINVDTYEGVVRLRGQVSNTISREQAEKLARSTQGVKDVVNEIKVVRPETS